MIKYTCAFNAVEKQSDGSVKIKGMANTVTTDRVGDTIVPEAWKRGGLNNYRKNPIILFNHNYDTPIGKGTKVEGIEDGLYLEATISGNTRESGLIKDGVLKAFSVGFIIKEADYIEETGGLRILDVELLEVSVVSVPANPNSLFSVSKSFDTEKDYKDFVNSLVGAPTSLQGEKSHKEPLMEPDELEALLAEAADKAAKKALAGAKLEEAEKAAAEKAEAEKAKAEKEAAEKAEAEKAKAEKEAAEKAAAEKEKEGKKTVSLIEEGAEKLLKDVETRLSEKGADFDKVFGEFKDEMLKQIEQVTQIQNSKRSFADRDASLNEDTVKALAESSLLNVVLGKTWDTNDHAKQIAEKAGIDLTNATDLDQEIANFIEKEVMVSLEVAKQFREITVNGGATVVPIQLDSDPAAWTHLGVPGGNLQQRGGSGNKYQPSQLILNAYRVISSTYLDDDVTEQQLVGFLPMLLDGVVRAHGRAIDIAVLRGNGNADQIVGLSGHAPDATASTGQLDISDGDKLTAAKLMTARAAMGKYGLNPRDVKYIVSIEEYYNLIQDEEFKNANEVLQLATKLSGSLGTVYGSEIVVSDNFEARDAAKTAAYAVYTPNFVIPRLRNLRMETDREVANQRQMIVGAQSLGFEELVGGSGDHQPVIKIDYVA